jgi:hypothetical protein
LASGTFEKTSLGWQIQQTQQRLGEWLERILLTQQSSDRHRMNWELPDWAVKGVFWLIILSLIGFAGWQLYTFLRPYLGSYWYPNRRSPRSTTADQAQHWTIAEWLQRSHQAQRRGDYREACRALYMAMLQHLDDTHLIQNEASRTDGEYLNLLQTLNQHQNAYLILIQTHEQLCFDQVAISAEVFDCCWQAYQTIQGSKPT